MTDATIPARLRQRARFLREALPHAMDFGDDRIINESSIAAIAELMEQAADALQPKPLPVHQCEEWQCRYVFPDQRCCVLNLEHDGPHCPAQPVPDLALREAAADALRPQPEQTKIRWRCRGCGHLWGGYEDTRHCDGGVCHNSEACAALRDPSHPQGQD